MAFRSPTERSEQLARSWQANAVPWTNAVRGQVIASRRLGTDKAILQAIRERRPRTLLDVGCGEGWLIRTVATDGVDATGIDASDLLIEHARAGGGGRFMVCSYADVTENPEKVGADYDVIVLNFAIFEEESRPLLRALATRLSAGGVLIIQTVHPWSDTRSPSDTEPQRDTMTQSDTETQRDTASQCDTATPPDTATPLDTATQRNTSTQRDTATQRNPTTQRKPTTQPYENGWRTESFAGMDDFSEPMPWYFRTMASWVDLLSSSGYRIEQLREPLHPDSGIPMSLLLIGSAGAAEAVRSTIR